MTETLSAELATQNISLPEEQIALLERYCAALWDWNRKLNLTRHTDYAKFVSRDLRDTIELARLVKPGEEVLDVGSGGGVPGIVLAILRPDLQVALSESVGKKAAALSAIVESLDLPVAVHHVRAEELLGDLRFHTLVARAVGPLDRLLMWLQQGWQYFDRLLAIKGPRWKEEEQEAARRNLLRGFTVTVVAQYPLPGTDSDSVILEIRRAANA